jgi:hypothetical protein
MHYQKDKSFCKVIFSYGQSYIIELEIKKAPATAGAFSVPLKQLPPLSLLLARN